MVSGSGNTNNYFTSKGLSLLTTAVVYGANASGKSNVMRAFDYMKSMVLNQPKILQSTDKIPYDPHRLSIETMDASGSFEMVFIVEGIKYRYGFEVDSTTVYAEWLFADEKGKEARLFFRDTEEAELYSNPDRFKEGKGIKVLPNSLFLWRCDQEGGPISCTILGWFQNLNILNGMQASAYLGYSIQQLKQQSFRDQMMKLIQAADLGIRDLSVEEHDMARTDIDAMPLPAELREQLRLAESPLKKVGLSASHQRFDSANNVVGTTEFDFARDESEGTKKYFCLSAPIIDTLLHGRILVIDELDASLHPMLTRALVKLFNDPASNPGHAQLIFATHDTNLLDQSLFHKSQIWFAGKDAQGASHVHSLAEYKNVRPGDNIEKHYIQGKFGAIPYLGEFSIGAD
jgi:energy-coupling factor transporter ATP-binding protein EcfA2